MTTSTTAAGNTPGRPAPIAPAVLDLLAAIRDGHAAYIRKRIAETPVTYGLWQDPDGGEQG